MLSLAALSKIVESHSEALSLQIEPFEVRGVRFGDREASNLMGVINLSADSWYRESICHSAEDAIERGMSLIKLGATVVDVGAESTLPDAESRSESEQQYELVPVVSGLVNAGNLVSVETYLPEVAKACFEKGAGILNLTGKRESKECYRMAAANDAAVIICFVGGDDVRNVKELDLEQDLYSVMKDYFSKEIEKANKVGLDKVFIDPGMGFYYRNLTDGRRRVQFQMNTFLNSFRFRELGYPICQALPHSVETFGSEVRTAEGFFAVLAQLGQASLFRTHEVARVKAVLDTMALFTS
ncbi:dihydropteroate synthase [Verrucomicrobia bacterium]|nr:dihydropteroate synthase [Verrucomicrobiota bacterium]